MQIRPETPADHAAIHALTQTAFASMSYSDGTEADCIDRLRADGDLTLSLVAETAAGAVGHVAFSPVFIDGRSDGWFGLGPVAVSPDLQKQGIGSALITEGLERLRARGARGCALIGNPDYYCRFGFISDGAIQYRDLPDRLVQWVAFGADRPTGRLVFSPGLE